MTRRIRFLTWCALGTSCIMGCGSTDRVPVEGLVTFDGQPIPKGTISFRPAENTHSPSAGAEIIDGKYFIPAENAPDPGRFRVEITAMRETGRSLNDPVFGPTDVEEQYLPPRYNTHTELTADISNETSDALNFNLKSN